MQRTPAVLLAIMLLLPLSGAVTGNSGDIVQPASSRARAPDAEPNVTVSDVHHRSAAWNFSDPGSYTIQGTVLAPESARLAKSATLGWLPMGDGPTVRTSHVAVWDAPRARMLVFGGNRGVTTNDLWAYSPPGNSWTQLTAGAIVKREEAAAAWDDADGAMFVYGGRDGAAIYSDLWAYYPATDLWSRKANAPVAFTGASAVWDPQNAQLLVIGGANDTQAFAEVFAYSPGSDSWAQRASLPAGRSHAVAVWNPEAKEVLLFGGKNGTNFYSETLSYNPATDLWLSKNPAPGPVSRASSAGAWDATRKRLLLLGGVGATSAFNDTWAYDPALNQWSGLSIAPAKRNGHAAVWDAAGGQFIVYGGFRNASGLSADVLAFSSLYLPSGRVESRVYFFGADFMDIDGISWSADVPAGTSLIVKARSSTDNRTWSPWEQLTSGGAPDNRSAYIQWGADIESFDGSLSPTMSSLIISVLRNSRPLIIPTTMPGLKREWNTLSANATDADDDELTFVWSQSGGPQVNLSDATAATPTFYPMTVGTYTFRVIASDLYGAGPAGSVTVEVSGKPPRAVLAANLTQADIGQVVEFNGSGSTDPDGKTGKPVEYLFDFGDGTNSSWTDRSATIHAYYQEGDYNVTLAVRDDDGNMSLFPSNLTMQVRNLNQPPTLKIAVEPATGGHTNTTFKFLANATDPDGIVVRVEWLFGDGANATTTAATPATHRFAVEGTYAVMARATDNRGAEATATLSVKVGRPPAPPDRPPAIVSFSPDPEARGKVGETVTFSVRAADPDGDELNYTWLMDGAAHMSGRANRTVWTPDRAGKFSMQVIVSDGNLSVKMWWNITVTAASTGSVGGSGPSPLLIGGVVLAIVAGVGGVFAFRLLSRRKRDEDAFFAREKAAPPRRGPAAERHSLMSDEAVTGDTTSEAPEPRPVVEKRRDVPPPPPAGEEAAPSPPATGAGPLTHYTAGMGEICTSCGGDIGLGGSASKCTCGKCFHFGCADGMDSCPKCNTQWH